MMLYNFDDLSFLPSEVERNLHTEGKFSEKEDSFARLILHLSGTANFRVKGKCLSARAGDVLFIPSNTSYEVDFLSAESISVHLKNCNYNEAEIFHLKNSNTISLMFFKLLEAWRETPSVNGAKSAVYAMLEKIEHDLKKTEENEALSHCLQYIDEHFCDASLDVSAVCNKAFISVSNLQRAFLAKFGMSPMQYIIKLRMNKALQLLSDDRISVKEISFLCGFSDEKYFSRAFKKLYGYSPSQLRGNVAEYCFVNKSCRKA